MSTLAHPTVAYTAFPDLGAKTAQRREESWDQIVARIKIPDLASIKEALPLLSGATYGDKRTAKGALRSDENLEMFCMLIGDHDAGTMQPKDAAKRLKALGMRAVVHTTPRHTDAAPRWHVLVPLSRPYQPSEALALMARLNGALNGALSSESFTASQSFYTGAVRGKRYRSYDTREQRCLDEVEAIAGLEIWPKPNGGGNGAAGTDLETRILSGAAGVHEALRDLALDLRRHDKAEAEVIGLLRGIMERAAWRQTDAKRWQERYAEIPRLCKVAVKVPEVELDFAEDEADAEVDAADLLVTEFQPMRSIVRDTIVEGLNILASRPKIGKTWLSLALALAHGNGAEFLRQRLQPGQSLLVALEDGNRRLQERLRKLGTVLGTPARGSLHIRHAWPRGPEGAAKLDTYLERNPAVRLAIFDTYRGLAPKRARGGDLVAEDYETTSAYQKVADRRRAAVVIVMHLRKGGDELDWIDQISGTHGLTAAADALLVLKRARGEDTATLSITGRDIEREAELGLRFDREHGLWLLLGSAAEVQSSEERREVLHALRVSGTAMTQK
ncbi:MAG TPA: AAA family ATPase, partial [Casimicrobiaceae bacterium]